MRFFGNRDRLVPARYWPGQALPGACQVSERPLSDDFAAFDAGAGAEVDEVVGRAHRVLIVLDDDDRVSLMCEPLQGREQPVVVARVQADRRLVEDVEHAHQPRADLAGQPDALCLAAGERGSRTIKRQVMQTDVQKEP